MALISSKTIITSISLFHITLAYFFLSKPKTIDDQALVYVLGESMGLPDARGFDAQSPALALLAVILAFFGISDLVSLSMPEELGALYYWGTQAPLRFFLSMLLVFYSYAFGPSSPMYASSSTGTSPNLSSRNRLTHNAAHHSGWGGDNLKNRLLFTFMFVEMIAWFWAWVTLREERHGLVEKLRKESQHSHSH